ncbi:glycosyl hydrolase family 18 protein [Marinicrinis lubricantis]|uniref:Glycosyl hydrolase family 18 protein n=1 Tax=Marinicrinis lubricantis TaxID=2086470 RepID=A0ABW1IJF9_9BACL
MSIMMTAVLVSVTLFLIAERPNNEHVTPEFSVDKPIFYKGESAQVTAIGEQESLKIPLSVIQEWIDSNVYLDEATDSIIFTTEQKVVQMRTDQLTAMVNDKPMELRFPVEKVGGEIYVPITPIREILPMVAQETSEGAVVIHRSADVVNWGAAPADTEGTVPVRTEATIKAPILYDLKQEERFMIWEENAEGWYRIQLDNGHIGYVQKKHVILQEPELIQTQHSDTQEYIPWKPIGEKINMTWEHVYSRNPDTSEIGPMPGLDVISPTWFSLADTEGNVSNKADEAYVKWAHERGYQVWALFSNDFTDPDKTSEILSTYDKRIKVIRQITAFVKMYNLQGINVDFENVYLEDRDRLTQFIRELTPFLHEQGAVISMDVTVHSTSEMWSMFYDRKRLAEVLDYMIVMAYDEHWASSPVAGSVASLPWVEKGISQILTLDDVPPSKMILGIPYYTRIWTEETVDGKKEVSSSAVGMETIQSLIEEKQLKPVYDEETGQNYVEYTEEGALKRIWIEDETSIQNRLQLVDKYNLAGIASWRRGFESQNVWPFIESYLK